MMGDQLERTNLVELYKKGKKIGETPGMLLELTPDLNKTMSEKWTYQLLVECKSLVKFTVLVMKHIRAIFEKFHSQTNEHHEFEWCIMIDNSGSMANKKNYVAEALVVLMEVLCKMECRFSVVRFGNKASQIQLKKLEDPFTYQLGEYILESLSYDEGTRPGSALKTTAQTLWGNKNKVWKAEWKEKETRGMSTCTGDGKQNQGRWKWEKWEKEVRRLIFNRNLMSIAWF
jgi:hypothetical protein